MGCVSICCSLLLLLFIAHSCFEIRLLVLAFCCLFCFFVNVSIRKLHCSFWFFVVFFVGIKTKKSNKRQKSSNGNQALFLYNMPVGFGAKMPLGAEDYTSVQSGARTSNNCFELVLGWLQTI